MNRSNKGHTLYDIHKIWERIFAKLEISWSLAGKNLERSGANTKQGKQKSERKKENEEYRSFTFVSFRFVAKVCLCQ